MSAHYTDFVIDKAALLIVVQHKLAKCEENEEKQQVNHPTLESFRTIFDTYKHTSWEAWYVIFVFPCMKGRNYFSFWGLRS